MKIEELIRLHNETLNRKVDQDPFLNQRIKARLKEREHTILTKPVIVYGFIFILFTVLNLMVIDRLSERTALNPIPEIVTQIDMTAFHPAFPGSIGKAYQEVIK
jgi:hypothetical protein